MSARTSQTFAAILLGGIIAATIDIGAACLINMRSPEFILHAIAGGLLAKQAYSGGASTAVLGLLLQEGMGILIAAIYAAGITLIPSLRPRWMLSGLLSGVLIFAVMNYVVLPLSAWHSVPHFSPAKFIANLIAMLVFGVIIAAMQARAPRTA